MTKTQSQVDGALVALSAMCVYGYTDSWWLFFAVGFGLNAIRGWPSVK